MTRGALCRARNVRSFHETRVLFKGVRHCWCTYISDQTNGNRTTSNMVRIIIAKYYEHVNLYRVWSAEVRIFLKHECHLSSGKLKTGGLLGIAQLFSRTNFEVRDGYAGANDLWWPCRYLTRTILRISRWNGSELSVFKVQICFVSRSGGNVSWSFIGLLIRVSMLLAHSEALWKIILSNCLCIGNVMEIIQRFGIVRKSTLKLFARCI